MSLSPTIVVFLFLLSVFVAIVLTVYHVKGFLNYRKKDSTISCDHIFFPCEENGMFIGQKCSMCGKFNSCESLGIKPFKGRSSV